MKNTFQRSLVLLLAMTVLALALVCSASASQAEEPKPRFLLALGDSLTTGYGLDNYVPGGDPYLCSSYINRIAQAMGLEGGQTYINRAVNGDKSSDLAKLIPNLENEVRSADMIIITIGGNDLLSAVPMIASRISGTNVTDSAEAIRIFASTTAETYATLANDPAFQEQFSTLITSLEANLKIIAGFIQEKAPHARVIFLKQFNPLKNIPGFVAAGNFAGTLLASINSTLEHTCTAYGYEVIDVPSVIDSHALSLTNILNFDIHPNEKGHTEIAKLLAKHLGLSLGLPGENEEPLSPKETTEIPEETTTAPEEVTVAPAVTTTAPETAVEETAKIEEIPDTGMTTEPTFQKGCTASAGCTALLLTSVCAAYALRKKKL